MRILRTLVCIGMIVFLLFTPGALVKGAQASFEDARFIRDTDRYTGSILLYHIVRHRPYEGSLSQWLKARAAEYEKKHKGTYIEIEAMDEAAFYERMERGRLPDAYSFFSGTLYPDRLLPIASLETPLREGLFETGYCLPYCYSGYAKLFRTPENAGEKIYCADDVLAARLEAGKNETTEQKADVLYLDLRRAGDLIRYSDGFALAQLAPVDSFTDAVCWIGIDRETDERKTEAILGFTAYLLSPDAQQTLNALGLLSVRSDLRNVPPEASLKQIFERYETVETVDPFRWNAQYDALRTDAALARAGDDDARARFWARFRECTE